MNANEAHQDSQLISDIDKVLKDYNDQTMADLDLDTGVWITFSKYDTETGLVKIYVDPNPHYSDVSTTVILLSLNLVSMNLTMARYIPKGDMLFNTDQVREHIKQFPKQLYRMPHQGRRYLSDDERAIPLMAVKRYIFESKGEFFNIAIKILGREITREEIQAIIKNAEKFLIL